jgi:hypothetical protein
MTLPRRPQPASTPEDRHSLVIEHTLAFAQDQLTFCLGQVTTLAAAAHDALRTMSTVRATFQDIDAAYLLIACSRHMDDPEFITARDADAVALSNAFEATKVFNAAHDALLQATKTRRNWEIIVNTLRMGQLVSLNATITHSTTVLDSLPEESEDDETYNPNDEDPESSDTSGDEYETESDIGSLIHD